MTDVNDGLDPDGRLAFFLGIAGTRYNFVHVGNQFHALANQKNEHHDNQSSCQIDFILLDVGG